MNLIREATTFLLDVLKPNLPEHAHLQTKFIASRPLLFSHLALLMEKHAKYVPTQLRSMSRNESKEYAQIRKRVHVLLNWLGESNVEGIAGEISSIFQFLLVCDLGIHFFTNLCAKYL